MELGLLEDAPFAFSALFDRIEYPPRGMEGGGPGGAGGIRLGSGGHMDGKGTQTVPRGDRVVIDMPGGGGLGDPKARDAEIVATDIRAGIVSRKAGRDLYGVAVTLQGDVDSLETAKLRAGTGK